MLRYATWKVAAIIGMTLIALLVVVPSMLSPSTRQAISQHLPWLPMRTIVLGLDLQGGSHVLLEVDQASVLKTQVDNLRDDVRRVLREERLPITGPRPAWRNIAGNMSPSDPELSLSRQAMWL